MGKERKNVTEQKEYHKMQPSIGIYGHNVPQNGVENG
jgi:hypothetical protein